MEKCILCQDFYYLVLSDKHLIHSPHNHNRQLLLLFQSLLLLVYNLGYNNPMHLCQQHEHLFSKIMYIRLFNRVIQKGQKFQMMEIPISHPKFLLFKSKAFQKCKNFQKILISRYCYLRSKF